MANRNNHYEAAFEEYLRDWTIPYVAVDESRRSMPNTGESIKSLDFIVSPDSRMSWLVDIKGRRFPAGVKNKQYWKNWSTQDDLQSLARWETFFGTGFTALLVFAFEVVGDRSPLPSKGLFNYNRRLYAFLGVRLNDYLNLGRIISPRWQTVAMSAVDFRRTAKPVSELFAIERNYPQDETLQ